MNLMGNPLIAGFVEKRRRAKLTLPTDIRQPKQCLMKTPYRLLIIPDFQNLEYGLNFFLSESIFIFDFNADGAI
jgi:hypothetical protein